MTAASKEFPHVEVTSWGCFARRTRLVWGEADALQEGTGSTGEARRGTGPSAYAKIVEITSGTTLYQQGLAATCEDQSEEHIAELAGGIGWGA